MDICGKHSGLQIILLLMIATGICVYYNIAQLMLLLMIARDFCYNQKCTANVSFKDNYIYLWQPQYYTTTPTFNYNYEYLW